MDIKDQPKERRLGQMPGHNDPLLQSLEQYWETLRDATRLPARTDLSPNMIDHALPNAFILQRVAPGIGRFRVAGQRLHDLLKMDARGMPLSVFFTADAREQAQQLLESAFMSPAIVSIPLVSSGSLLRPEINGTMLLLPMRDNAGKTTRMLGALVCDDYAGSRARRFSIPQSARIRHDPLGVQLAATQMIPQVPMKKPDAARPALKLVVNNG